MKLSLGHVPALIVVASLLGCTTEAPTDAGADDVTGESDLTGSPAPSQGPKLDVTIGGKSVVARDVKAGSDTFFDTIRGTFASVGPSEYLTGAGITFSGGDLLAHAAVGDSACGRARGVYFTTGTIPVTSKDCVITFTEADAESRRYVGTARGTVYDLFAAASVPFEISFAFVLPSGE